MFRIGYGTDIHTLAPGIPLMLGGIHIPSEYGCEAHSDGDTVIHALCDALFGALSLGDIGTHFPDSDPQWKNVASSIFLEYAVQQMRSEGFRIGNADINIHLENPKLRPYIQQIREHLAALFHCEPGLISVKAKTAEGTGAVGAGEAVRAEAVILLYQE